MMWQSGFLLIVAIVTVSGQAPPIDQQCAAQQVISDPSLAQCLAGFTGNQSISTTFNTICNSDCRGKLINFYQACAEGNIDVNRLIADLCVTNDDGQFCFAEFSALFDDGNAMGQMIGEACANASTTGCVGQCRQAIVDNLGCCYGSALNIASLFLDQATIDSINVCPDIAGCNGAIKTAVSTLVVLIAALLFAMIF